MTPTITMKFALADAVYAAYKRGWNGEMRQRSKRPSARLTFGRRRRPYTVGGQTWDALLARDLIKPDGTLTAEGVKVGEEEFTRRNDGRSANRAAEEERGKEQQEAQALQDKVNRAKHLFRGLKVTSGDGRGRNVSDRISTNGYSGNLWIDDLLSIGEGIEKLRR